MIEIDQLGTGKKRGRPRTGSGKPIVVRVHASLLAGLDEEIRRRYEAEVQKLQISGLVELKPRRLTRPELIRDHLNDLYRPK